MDLNTALMIVRAPSSRRFAPLCDAVVDGSCLRRQWPSVHLSAAALGLGTRTTLNLTDSYVETPLKVPKRPLPLCVALTYGDSRATVECLRSLLLQNESDGGAAFDPSIREAFSVEVMVHPAVAYTIAPTAIAKRILLALSFLLALPFFQ